MRPVSCHLNREKILLFTPRSLKCLAFLGLGFAVNSVRAELNAKQLGDLIGQWVAARMAPRKKIDYFFAAAQGDMTTAKQQHRNIKNEG